jgi:hypothetical protein
VRFDRKQFQKVTLNLALVSPLGFHGEHDPPVFLVHPKQIQRPFAIVLASVTTDEHPFGMSQALQYLTDRLCFRVSDWAGLAEFPRQTVNQITGNRIEAHLQIVF